MFSNKKELSIKENEEIARQIIKKMEENEQQVKAIVSNTDYILWLNRFTEQYPTFSDEEWLYFPERLADDDREQVERLKLMYSGIASYARKNYIYSTPSQYGPCYRIKLGNIGYEIGILLEVESTRFCNRTQINKALRFIDFNDIIQDRKPINADSINKSLDKLSSMIISLYEAGIPLGAISETVNQTIREVEKAKEDKGNVKVLRKN